MQTEQNFLADRLLHLQERAVEKKLQVSLIVDQSAFPRMAEAQRLLSGLDVRNVLKDMASADLDGASPLLLSWPQLASPPVALVRWLYTQGRCANAVSVLLSSLPPPQLHTELSQRTHVMLPGNLLMVLRYFDTRMLPLLPRMLAPEQYGAFTGCAAEWHYLGRDGALMQLPPPAVAHAGLYTSPLNLTDAQERLLLDDGLADSVIDQLLDADSPSLRGLDPAQQYERISPLVADAGRWGLSDTMEVLAYVDTALHEGGDFAQREPWSHRLAEFRRGEISLATALEGVPE
jgi:hypothetical protein